MYVHLTNARSTLRLTPVPPSGIMANDHAEDQHAEFPRGNAGHPPRSQPADRAEPHSRASADLPRRAREAHERAPCGAHRDRARAPRHARGRRDRPRHRRARAPADAASHRDEHALRHRRGGRVLYAPRLGWRDVDLRDALARHVDIPVFVESAPIACALARLWTVGGESRAVNNFAYVSISDGVGVGIVVHGEVLRGEAHTAGEFGHVSLDPFGPQCACGKRGCWEAFCCNAATSRRYVEEVAGAHAGKRNGARPGPLLPVEEIVRRAKRGERAAEASIAATGREIGRGLAAVVNAINPKRIYLGGEITAAWDVLEKPIRDALVEGTLTTAARETPIIPDRAPGEYRVLGAVALVAAPSYAAPRVG